MIESFNENTWYPLGAATDVPARHVYQTTLDNQELAVWRDDLGNVNVWENRCPHRGLRLSLGINDGRELRCQYHGWTYQSGSGACTFVPAHRQAEQATKACARAFPAREFAGLIWSTLGTEDTEATEAFASEVTAPACNVDTLTNLRSVVIAAGVAQVRLELLEQRERFATLFSWPDVREFPPLHTALSLQPHSADWQLVFFLQPHSADKCLVHPVIYARHAISPALQKQFALAIGEIRRKVETRTGGGNKEQRTFIPIASGVKATATAAEAVGVAPIRKTASFDCRIVARKQECTDIVSYRLAPIDRPLPRLVPGMHVQIETPSGVARQYSLVNRPDETQEMIIAVKLEVPSRGGSQSMHEAVHEGSLVKVTLPRNGFPLRANDREVALLAAGIGITPILAMAHALQGLHKHFSLHYFSRAIEYVPFTDRLASLGDSLHQYLGLGTEESVRKFGQIIDSLDPHATDIYVCGPAVVIETVRSLALQRGFAEENIHFEYFGKAVNASDAVDMQPFEVELAKSALSFIVPAESTLLQACASHGVHIESSCEQGVCGACTTTVLAGDMLHRDSYLTEAEKAAGKLILPCVSRASQGKLVLDL